MSALDRGHPQPLRTVIIGPTSNFQHSTPVMSAMIHNDDVSLDEETPLLSSDGGSKKPSDVPWSQVGILLVLQLAEPLTSQVIYPFTPEVRYVLPDPLRLFSCVVHSSFVTSGLPMVMSLV